MRPRLLSRGKASAANHDGVLPRRFNEAATVKSRKGAPPALIAAQAERFNEAATVKSRKATVPLVHLRPTNQLQ